MSWRFEGRGMRCPTNEQAVALFLWSEVVSLWEALAQLGKGELKFLAESKRTKERTRTYPENCQRLRNAEIGNIQKFQKNPPLLL